ncbi:MAG: hypothetical protein WA993_01830 [Candidatus Binatus sp.]|jgi:hypothetical protein|uniref:hypothetical protein n=1 Tax=Candidatus Binatus sp. TaxID=2811406 RepID=UPI003CC0BC19
MTQRLFCSMVIAAALTLAAGRPGAAQTVAPDLVSAQRDSGISGTSANLSAVEPTSKKLQPVCKPCLFYSGDSDSSNPDTNSLINGIFSAVPILAQVYSAFTVPSGRAWHVKGVFINTVNAIASVVVLDPSVTQWSIWADVGSGNPGELLFSGAGNATVTATGRTVSGLTEYTVSVKLKTAIVLQPGTYWLNVTPQCTNPSDSACSSALFYESDVEDVSPANHVGPANVLDDSFINSTYFSFNYAHTWGGSGACGGIGCDAFSFGLIGTE